jgi:hypothetical protein
MYSPKFEQDFLRHIPNKNKQKYLDYLVLNIGLFAESEKNESRQRFLYFLISRESLDLVKKQGATILYNDENLKGA